MPTIIIMNNATEQMLGRRLNRQQAKFAAQAAMRNVWLASPGDIIVATHRPDQAFLSYLAKMLGWDISQKDGVPIRFVTPADAASGVVLNDEILLDPSTIEAIRCAAGTPDGWTLLACYQTAGTARLQDELALDATGGQAIGRRFAAQFGTDLLNRKSHFRQFAVGAGVPVPEGAIVHSPIEFAWAVAALLPRTGSVMVKLDNGAGGTGNIVLSAAVTGPLPGARQSIPIPAADDGDRAEMIAEIWRSLQESHAGPIVVEAYHPADAMVYLEFVIDPGGGGQFLNTGSIRVRRHADPQAPDMFWVGLELPAALPPAFSAEAMLHCGRLLGLAAAMGYRGHINFDAILTCDGDLLFNEVNARWGGGTVLHEVAARLLGNNFTASHVAASFRDVPSPGFGPLVALLERNGLAYDGGRRDGIVILACDDLHTHCFEALVIARNGDAARAMERRLVDLLDDHVGMAA